jgi:hypothetical protein
MAWKSSVKKTCSERPIVVRLTRSGTPKGDGVQRHPVVAFFIRPVPEQLSPSGATMLRCKHVEKIPRHYRGGDRKWWKRFASKVMRRLGRVLLDDAPRKVPTRGWAD